MKNFTSLLMALLVAGSAVAAPVQKSEAKLSELTPKTSVVKSVKKSPAAALKSLREAKHNLLNSPKAGMRKAAARKAAPITDQIVLDAPEGTKHLMSHSSNAYDNGLGLTIYEDKGLIVHMVEGTDGKVWFDNPCAFFSLLSYFYGTREGDIITIPGGQLVYSEYDEEYDETMYVYLCALVYDEASDWFTPSDDNAFQLQLVDGVWKAVDPELILGICAYVDASILEDEGGEDDYDYEEYSLKAVAEEENNMIMYWLGWGDFDVQYAYHTDTPVAAPAGLATEKWAFITADGGYHVKGGFDGNDIYVQGMYNLIPESWVKLTVDGDKAVMKSGQYLGEDTDYWHFGYAFGGTLDWEYDEEWDDYVEVTVAAECLEFAYDAQAKTLKSQGLLLISGTGDELHTVNYIENPCLEYQNRAKGTAPATPTYANFVPFDIDYGYCQFDFNVFNTDTEGNLLDSSRLFYNIYIDGELFTAYQDEYNFNEDMTDFPWSFADSWNIYKYGSYFSMYFFMTDFDTIGVQSYYVEDDGSKTYSEPMTYDVVNDVVVNGIGNVALDNKEVKAVKIFDLQGREVANPGAGVYIQRTLYSDGSVKASKIRK